KEQPPSNKNVNSAHPMCNVKVTPKIDTTTGRFFCSSAEATKKLLTTVSLIGKPVGIQRMWNSSNNGITIRCRTKEEADELVQVVQSNVGNKVEVAKPKMRNPAFTLVATLEDDFKDDQGRVNKAAL